VFWRDLFITVIGEEFPQFRESEQELAFIQQEGIALIRLLSIITQLNENKFQIQSASGADFADLINLASQKT